MSYYSNYGGQPDPFDLDYDYGGQPDPFELDYNYGGQPDPFEIDEDEPDDISMDDNL